MATLPEPTQVIEQVNHYLDDAYGALSEARIMLRVRVASVDGKARPIVVTAKRRREISDGVFVADEYEQTLTAAQWQAVLSGQTQLSEIAGEAIDWLNGQVDVWRLAPFGQMTNRRVVVEHAGLVLEVDRTSFPDGSVDAEVEVETAEPERARAVVQSLAAKANVELFNQTAGKYARFLERR